MEAYNNGIEIMGGSLCTGVEYTTANEDERIVITVTKVRFYYPNSDSQKLTISPITGSIGQVMLLDSSNNVIDSRRADISEVTISSNQEKTAWSGSVAFMIPKTHDRQSYKVKFSETCRIARHSNGYVSDRVMAVSTSLSVSAKTSYYVECMPNGGSGYMLTQTKWHNEALAIPSASGFSKVGYTFAGWMDEYGNAYYPGQQYNGNANLDLYAQWAANPYSIAYEPNWPANSTGRAGSMAATACTYDAPVTLRANAFSCRGYSFDGWATTPYGSVAYQNGQQVANLAIAGTVTLYAVWTCTHGAPTVSNLDARRVDAQGNGRDDGDYMLVTANLSAQAGYSCASVTLMYKRVIDADWTYVTDQLSGQSVSYSKTIGTIGKDDSYQLMLVLYDDFTQTDGRAGQVTAAEILPQAFYTLDFMPGGRGVAIGCAATEEGFKVGIRMLGQIDMINPQTGEYAGKGNLYGSVGKPTDAAISYALSNGIIKKPYVMAVAATAGANMGVYMDEG